MMFNRNESYPIWKRIFIHFDFIHLISNLIPLIFFVYMYDLIWYTPILYFLSLIILLLEDKLRKNTVYGASIIVNIAMGMGLLLHPDYTYSGCDLYNIDNKYQLSWVVGLIILSDTILFIYSIIYAYNNNNDYDSHLAAFIIGVIAGSYLKQF